MDNSAVVIRRCGAARSELYSLLCSQQIVDVTNPTGNLARKDAKVRIIFPALFPANS